MAGKARKLNDPTTFRFPWEQEALIGAAAELDGVTPTEILRTAVAEYIGRRTLTDPDFAQRVRAVGRQAFDEGVARVRETLGGPSQNPPYPPEFQDPETA